MGFQSLAGSIDIEMMFTMARVFINTLKISAIKKAITMDH